MEFKTSIIFSNNLYYIINFKNKHFWIIRFQVSTTIKLIMNRILKIYNGKIKIRHIISHKDISTKFKISNRIAHLNVLLVKIMKNKNRILLLKQSNK